MLARIDRSLRVLVPTALLVAALGVAAYYWAAQRADEEIRLHCQQRFSEAYADRGWRVTVGEARLISGEGIELRGIAVVDPAAGNDEVLVIERAFLATDVELAELLHSRPNVEHVRIDRPRLRVVRGSNGEWDIARLLPLDQSKGKPPSVTIVGGTVELIDSSMGDEPLAVLRDLQAAIVPGERSAETESAAIPTAGPPPLRIYGKMSGSEFRAATFDATLRAGGEWTLSASFAGVELSPKLLQLAPPERSCEMAPLASVEGKSTVHVNAAGGGDLATHFVVWGNVREGRIRDPRLPYPLTDVSAEFYVDPSQVRIDRLTASSGLGQVELSGRQSGLSAGSPLVLAARVENLRLNDRMADVLPGEAQLWWRDVSPTGIVNLDAKLTFDGERWQPDILLECVDTSFALADFPYRLTGCRGRVHHLGDKVTIELAAKASGRTVRIDGEFVNPGPDGTGGVDVTLDGAVPLDDKLLAALPGDVAGIVGSFQPRGKLTYSGRIERLEAGAEMSHTMEIGLVDCSVRYEGFPYAFDRLHGRIIQRGGHWDFLDLEARHGSAYFVGRGSWEPAPAGGTLILTVTGNDVPLDEDLRQALSPDIQSIFSDMRPRGSIDNVMVNLGYDSSQDRLSVDAVARKWKQSSDGDSRSVSVRPVWFPYRLDNLAGTIRYNNGEIELHNLSADRNGAEFTLAGVCAVAAGGDWRVNLSRLTADRLTTDHELIAALPAGLGKSLDQLNVTGPVWVDGSLELAGGPGRETIESRWDMTFELENGGIHCGPDLGHVHGGARFWGQFDERGFRSRGALAIDSAILHGVQLTAVRGPLWIDDERVLVGSWTRQAAGGAALPVTARLFGGSLSLDGSMLLDEPREFALRAVLNEADLTAAAGELAPGRGGLEGSAHAMLELYGTSLGTDSWRGAGLVRLRNADVHELPVILAMYKLLPVSRGEDTAFNSAEVDFHIQGDHVVCDKINLHGEAVTLKGRGWLNLDRQIDVDFYAVVGQDRVRVPVISPLLGVASRQLLLIHLDGSLDDPKLEKEVLPGLNDTLRRLFPELEEDS